jgi:hypothetical protein
MRNKSNSFFLTKETSLQHEMVTVKLLRNVGFIDLVTHKMVHMVEGEVYDMPVIQAMEDSNYSALQIKAIDNESTFDSFL